MSDIETGIPLAHDLSVAPESPRQEEAVRLVEALDAYLKSLYPTDICYLLDVEALSQPDIRFFVARRDGKAVGCAALRVDPDGYGEVKRMYVDPTARGGGIARRLMARIEKQAHTEGLTALRLETGVHQTEALALYRKLGFRERRPFAGYTADPLSVFMEKSL